MSLRKLMNQPCTVQAVGNGTDEYGNTVPVAVGPPVSAVGYFEQVETIEYLLDRQTVVTKTKGFFPEEVVIAPRAWVNFQSEQFQVDGEPWHVYNPRTKLVSHIECKLTVVS